ncbi:HlyD family secretion protein [Vibrio sp. Vf1514]|uniref:HlyD family secretion protein n=1 Tax=Vibrio sp. Vf1514 TaxID=3437381 RepID=UPI003F8A3A84
MKKSIIALAALGTLALGGWKYWQQQQWVTTDNAYVKADVTLVSPEVSGRVTHLFVRDNQWVKAGDPLFQIDNQDYQANVNISQAAIAVAQSALANNDSRMQLQKVSIEQAKTAIEGASANAQFQHSERQRFQKLLRSASVSQTAFDNQNTQAINAQATLKNTRLALDAAHQQLNTLAAEREQLNAQLKQAQSKLALNTIALQRTLVKAPVDGFIANRQVQEGKFVQPGMGTITLIPETVWLNANFKETQLSHLIAGQTVDVRLDMYPDTVIAGLIDSITPATGAQFSMIPPQNATGNFVKVVQRVPVKITLTLPDSLKGRVYPGLSAVVSIALQP